MTLEPLSILVDENVPYGAEAFGRVGRVRAMAGRKIGVDDVRHTDVLIVRSVTRVDAALLTGSRVRFVGTATIGTDHVDTAFLRANGIEFCSAPGSNAMSVAEYVVAALLRSAHARGQTLDGATLAVVGVGNVGSRVIGKARALGLEPVLVDPPRQREEPRASFVDLAEALPQADYVTLHVPLTKDGPDATAGMADAGFFARMKPGAVFFNTSRGGVHDETALAEALDSGRIAHAVLDVWKGEPAIDPETLRRAFIATPHIAGYSFDGKVAATVMLYQSLCRFLSRPEAIDLGPLLPPPSVPRVDLTGPGTDEDLLRKAVSAVYDIEEDDRALRVASLADPSGAAFDRLRKEYPQRREFRHTTVVMTRDRVLLARQAAGLGFHVETK
jgi:erythronate-4-phosphate dehydrogenase